MPGKTARALCPVCQEPMPPDETECENCGAFVIDEAVVRLSRAFGIPREKALALFEKGFRHPKQLQDRDVDDVLKRGEGGLLYLCTNCGGFVAAGDSKCARCGAEFEGEAEEPREEKDILDQVLCPVCGADNDPAWKECEICGEPLGGTEEPPGEAPQPPAVKAAGKTEGPVPAPPVDHDRIPEPHALETIDGILSELDEPPPPAAAPVVRRIQKVPKKTKSAKPIPTPPPVPSGPPAKPSAPAAEPPTLPPKALLRPTPRTPIRPVLRPAPSAPDSVKAPAPLPPIRTSKPHPEVMSGRRSTWAVPPAEFTGGVVVAAAAILYVARMQGETIAAWGAAVGLTILSIYVLVTGLSRMRSHMTSLDVGLLSVGGLLGVLAPAAPLAIVPGLSVAGAILLAAATRRLLRTPARDLLAVASAASLVALAAAAAQGLAVAGTPGWALGLLAAAPWPAAVVAEEIHRRRFPLALRRELAKAERDVQREDYAQSLKDYDRAIAASAKGAPGEDLPWYGKGATLILLGRYDEALRAIDVALDLNPRNEVAWLNKGNALTKMGRLLDALRCFNAAIKVNPRYEVAWNNKGNTLARLGHYDEALKCYERALEIDPNYRGAWVNKGYVLTKLGRYNEATSCADRALRLHDPAGFGAT